MENMSSGVKREVLPKYAVRYRKRAIGVNRFMDSWKKVIINLIIYIFVLNFLKIELYDMDLALLLLCQSMQEKLPVAKASVMSCQWQVM